MGSVHCSLVVASFDWVLDGFRLSRSPGVKLSLARQQSSLSEPCNDAPLDGMANKIIKNNFLLVQMILWYTIWLRKDGC